MREQLFQGLFAGDVESDQIAAIATSLGFDVRGAFTAVAFDLAGGRLDVAERVAAAVRTGPGVRHSVSRGGSLYLLTQGTAVRALLDATDHMQPLVGVGIGANRLGLRGAHLSLGDAERALALAVRRGVPCEFTVDWLPATLLVSAPRLTEMLGPATGLCARERQLAETVRAFATSFSQSAAARELGVHVNTVAYRLTRWQELTDWNPRTFDGLARSLVALELVGDAPAAAG
jgi:sugar diacid utilization regulator